MHRQGILSITAMMVSALALSASSAVGQQKSLKDQLAGSWILVSQESTRPDGSKVQGYGSDPKGINIFSPDGRFAVIFTRPDLPKLASPDRSKATPEEAKAIVAGSIGYFGTYTVDEAAKTITYRVEGTTFRNQPVEQKRLITALTADELRYRNPAPTAGGQIEVVLKRAK